MQVLLKFNHKKIGMIVINSDIQTIPTTRMPYCLTRYVNNSSVNKIDNLTLKLNFSFFKS